MISTLYAQRTCVKNNQTSCLSAAMGLIFLSLGKKLKIAVFRRDSFSATNDMASIKNASPTMSLLRLGLSFLLSF